MQYRRPLLHTSLPLIGPTTPPLPPRLQQMHKTRQHRTAGIRARERRHRAPRNHLMGPVTPWASRYPRQRASHMPLPRRLVRGLLTRGTPTSRSLLRVTRRGTLLRTIRSTLLRSTPKRRIPDTLHLMHNHVPPTSPMWRLSRMRTPSPTRGTLSPTQGTLSLPAMWQHPIGVRTPRPHPMRCPLIHSRTRALRSPLVPYRQASLDSDVRTSEACSKIGGCGCVSIDFVSTDFVRDPGDQGFTRRV